MLIRWKSVTVFILLKLYLGFECGVLDFLSTLNDIYLTTFFVQKLYFSSQLRFLDVFKGRNLSILSTAAQEVFLCIL